MKKFIATMSLFLVFQIEIFGLNNCSYKDEIKLSSISDATKNTEDFTSTISVTKEIYNNWSIGGKWGGLTFNASCNNGVLTDTYYDIAYGDDYYLYFDRISNQSTNTPTTRTNMNWRGGNVWGNDYRLVYGHSATGYYCLYTDKNIHCSGLNSGRDTIYFASCFKDITTNECPSGFSGTPCQKTVSYSYKNYTCDANDKNSQGFGWELTSPLTNDGSKVDPDPNSISSSTLDDTIYSHAAQPNCKRKYQECTIDCEAPLTLETSTGKCIMSYETDCIAKGMTYNSTLNICEKQNNCNDVNVFEDYNNTKRCLMLPNCNVVDGKCTLDAIKSCNNNLFNYRSVSNLCEKETQCNSSQILLDNGYCGSTSYCKPEDTTFSTNCMSTTNIQKSCAPDARDGNLCYKSSPDENMMSISMQRPLSKISISGSFKESEFGQTKGYFCSSNDENCTFRLTDIYSANGGKSLCFKDHLGSFDCINVSGDCIFNGSIHHDGGIRQLLIEGNGNTLTAFNKFEKSTSLGSITSTCTLSGKVGYFDNTSTYQGEIIAIKPNGIDLEFWNPYLEGAIGVITFLPTIPTQDSNEGYKYADKDISSLLNKNFTGFYTKDNKTYGVYNGLISRDDCIAKISGTSFYVDQAQTEIEVGIYNMLSFLANGNYNYNNGNTSMGSCVIKSDLSKSFNAQEFSVKTTQLSNGLTKYVCSSLKCDDHTCQYNQCPNQFNGNIFEANDFTQFMQEHYPTLTQTDICTGNTCDSKLPYYPYCGSNNGCETKDGVFQQGDGSCVKVGCNTGETFDPSVNKCVKLDCKDSIKRGDKCYKILTE